MTKTTIFANSRWRTAAVLKKSYFSRELSDFDQIRCADANFHSADGYLTENRHFCKFQMVDGRHIENPILAISRRYIGRLIRNLEWRWRIPCGYRSRARNGSFRKVKIAVGRHFENSFISVCQLRIMRFLSNLVSGCKFPFRRWIFDREISEIQDGGGRHIENHFGYISAPF